MIQKIHHLVETVLHGLADSDCVECVQRIPYHGGGLPESPLFCIKLDVFYRESIPSYPKRLEKLDSLRFVETALSKAKDRFFLEDVPIHLDYKLKCEVEKQIDRLDIAQGALQHDTTYGLFRLFHGIPVHTKSNWIRDIKARIEQLPEAFWTLQTQNLSSRMEHLLSDMAAAVFNRDNLFFQIALAKFIETIAELLFAINRQFACPPEEMKFQLDGLEILPNGFTAWFESLLREDAGFNHERRLGLARHLAEGILVLI